MAEPSAPSATKRVFRFGNGTADGDASMKSLLGGKGANLAEMSSIGLSVPAGFTVTTEVCAQFHENAGELPEGCWDEMMDSLAFVEECMGKKLGDPENPLLLSVRSGAAVSMPGMMDTVLNLGLNDDVAEGLAPRWRARSSRTTRTADSWTCTATSSWASSTTSSNPRSTL